MNSVIKKTGISLFLLAVGACGSSFRMFQNVEVAGKTYLVPYESGVIDSNKEFKVAPVYPEWALKNCIEGWVRMGAILQSDGSLENVFIMEAKPKGVFDTVAVEAFSRWRFNPQRFHLKKLPHRVRQVLSFKIPNGTATCPEKSDE